MEKYCRLHLVNNVFSGNWIFIEEHKPLTSNGGTEDVLNVLQVSAWINTLLPERHLRK